MKAESQGSAFMLSGLTFAAITQRPVGNGSCGTTKAAAPCPLVLGLFGLDVGHLVEEAIRKIVDLLVPDFAAGWATSLVTALVAVPDVSGPGFERLDGLREQLLGVGFALLSLCVVAGGLQVWLAGIATGGLRAGELLRR